MDDLEMMQSPLEWPRYPVLPIKRPVPQGGWPECAILLAGRSTVYLTGLYSLSDLAGRTYGEKLAAVEKKEYASFAAVVADGWVVD